MASYARTQTVTTSDTGVVFPADKYKDGYYKIRNLDGTNGIWIRIMDDGAAAVAEADETEFVGPGEAIVVPYMAQCRMIAVGGNVKVNVVASIGRPV